MSKKQEPGINDIKAILIWSCARKSRGSVSEETWTPVIFWHKFKTALISIKLVHFLQKIYI